MRRLDPEYKGFRGPGVEPDRRRMAPLAAAVCTVCGRRRNVPRGIALERGEHDVCSRCIEEGRAPELAATSGQ